jgi:hypothetical protein
MGVRHRRERCLTAQQQRWLRRNRRHPESQRLVASLLRLRLHDLPWSLQRVAVCRRRSMECDDCEVSAALARILALRVCIRDRRSRCSAGGRRHHHLGGDFGNAAYRAESPAPAAAAAACTCRTRRSRGRSRHSPVEARAKRLHTLLPEVSAAALRRLPCPFPFPFPFPSSFLLGTYLRLLLLLLLLLLR